MRATQLFGRTIYPPASEGEIKVVSTEFLERAGYVAKLAAGIYTYLPIGWRAIRRIEQIIREEIESIGGQELSMPVVHPAEIWKQTGRWYRIENELTRFEDRNGRQMVLAMTHEEVVATIAKNEIQSYKQLPKLVFQVQTKWRDDPRPRAGLIRTREFIMKDSYSLDADADGLDIQYRNHYEAYFRIFKRCGLPTLAVESDVGMMGGRAAHEFMYLTSLGEDTLILCNSCDYAANQQVATFDKKKGPNQLDVSGTVERVSTPETSSAADVAELLGIRDESVLKTMFYMVTFDQQAEEATRDFDGLVAVAVLGNTEVSETKLANVLRAKSIRPASREELNRVGAVEGYASPIGLREVPVVVDDLVPQAAVFVAGANERDVHLINIEYGRDFRADIVADVVKAVRGKPCPRCGSPLSEKRAVEVGNIFKLGTKYSEDMDVRFQGEDGQQAFVHMGSYGIGVGRLLACLAEEYADEKGLCWPFSVAPYDVHLVSLHARKDDAVAAEAERLYERLTGQGIEVLYDDRDERAGVKLNDSDLMGLPLRVIVGKQGLARGCFEVQHRRTGVRVDVEIADASAQIVGIVDEAKKIGYSSGRH